jgi:putative ABC transport system permease protein
MLTFEEYIPQMMPLWLIVGVIVGATLLSILAGLYPARRASKLDVVEALRNE